MAKRKQQFTHKHYLLMAVSATFLVVSMIAVSASSSRANPSLNSGKELSAANCDTSGKPVINVTQKVVNSIDSGEGGNYWAYDNFNRHIQVWQNTTTEYCALVQYDGKFDSQAGQQSPGNTDTLSGKEDGTFKGGYRAKITGALRSEPGYKTNGSIGTVDYQCNIGGNCPGAVNWVGEYFGPSYTFSYEWWGWSYNYKNNTWVNSSDGNSGDII